MFWQFGFERIHMTKNRGWAQISESPRSFFFAPNDSLPKGEISTQTGLSTEHASIILPSLIALLIALTLAPAAAAADPNYYGYYPGTVMSLGIGLSPEDLTAPKVKCIDSQRTPLDRGALSTRFYVFAVSSAYEMKQAQKLDARVDASYLTVSAEGHYEVNDQRDYSGSDLTLVITAESEFPRQGLSPPIKLRTDAATLLHNDVKEFDRTCGSRLIVAEREGSKVSAIVTIRDVKSDVRNKVRAGASISGGYGPISGTAKFEAGKELNNASSEHRVEVEIASTGGEGFGKLAGTIAALSSFEAIQGELAKYLGSFTLTNPAPIGFFVGSMPGRNVPNEDLWSDEKTAKLGLLSSAYRTSKALSNQIDAVLRHDDPRSHVFKPDQMDQLLAFKPKLDHYLSQIAKTHRVCLQDSGVNEAACTVSESHPNTPAFFLPITTRPYLEIGIIVDGVLLNSTRAAAVLGDPGGGTILDRVKRRDGNARSATVVIVVNDNYLLDATVWLGGMLDMSSQASAKVFYPAASKGNRLVSSATGNLVISLGTEASDDFKKYDLSLSSLAVFVGAYASELNTSFGSTGPSSSSFYYVGVDTRDYFGKHLLVDVLYNFNWKVRGNQIDVSLTPASGHLLGGTYKTQKKLEQMSFEDYVTRYLPVDRQ
jgi:hypothetical protein